MELFILIIKMSKLTSIIFTAYDNNQAMRLITQAALQNIIKYTDEEDYELIFVDTIPLNTPASVYINPHYLNEFLFFNKRKDRKWVKRYCSKIPDPGQYACYNIGAKKAKGDYLCFFQNDVFVWEGWLRNMRWYLENGYDAVFPDQQYKTREFVKASYDFPFESEDARTGARDAGILYIKREAFDQIGGWNEDIKIHFGERDIYEKINGLKWTVTCKTMVTHLEHAAGWTKLELEPQKYNSDVTESVKVKNG